MQHALGQSSRLGPTGSTGLSPRERILETATDLNLTARPAIAKFDLQYLEIPPDAPTTTG